MKEFNVLNKEVEDVLSKSPLDFEIMHSRLVLKWVLKLKPDADESLKIAAIAHDIDRGVTGITEKDLADFSKINEFKKEHSIRSAKFICGILFSNHYPESIINKVKNLVENHEFGGDDETNILTDADSLAYFDYNIPFYLKRNGPTKTKAKIKFMYDRLTSNRSKEIAKPMYEEAISQLNLQKE